MDLPVVQDGCPDSHPFLSIITITLNNLAGLHQTVESVARQSSRDFQFIVVDGGSEDGTRQYLHESIVHIDRMLSEQDRGIYHAMNKGLALACGRFVMFMNAGDRFAGPDVLADMKRQVDQAEAQPEFIYGDSYEERDDGRGYFLKPAKSHSLVWYGMFTQHQSMAFSRKVIAQACMVFDERYRLAADWDFVVRYLDLISGQGRVLRMEVPISIFARRGASADYRKAIAEQFTIRRQTLGWSQPACGVLAGWHFMANLIRCWCPPLYYLYNTLRSAMYGKNDG